MDSAVAENRRPSLGEVSRFFLWLGAVSWGGMYAILPRVRAEVAEMGWMPAEDFGPLMAAATLVPGPSFVSMAGLVGYRARGAVGALVAMISLLIPPTVLVAGALIFLASGKAMVTLAPLFRLVTVTMGGVILGNAWKLMRDAPMRAAGLVLLVGTGAAVLAGLPVVWTVIVAVLAGRLLMGGERA